jgi:hypothetical protein
LVDFSSIICGSSVDLSSIFRRSFVDLSSIFRRSFVDFKNVCLAGLATICRRFFVDHLWIICRFVVDLSSIFRRSFVDFSSIICGSSVDLSSICRRFVVDCWTLSGRDFPKSTDFLGDFSLSGAANEVVFSVFFEGPQKWLKSPVLSMPAWIFTVHPDLPAGTPCYNFTGPTRNTV